jgi:hypothetical protein
LLIPVPSETEVQLSIPDPLVCNIELGDPSPTGKVYVVCVGEVDAISPVNPVLVALDRRIVPLTSKSAPGEEVPNPKLPAKYELLAAEE